MIVKVPLGYLISSVSSVLNVNVTPTPLTTIWVPSGREEFEVELGKVVVIALRAVVRTTTRSVLCTSVRPLLLLSVVPPT